MKNFQTVTIVGVGLIGGSIGLALRQRNLAARIIGTGSRPQTLETARQTGTINEVDPDVPRAVAASQWVIVCAPVDAIVPTIRSLAPHCAAGTLITDAGSTKEQIVSQLEAASQEPGWPAAVRFVGSHPLAGNEKTGPQNANADLFVGRTVIVTPGARTTEADVRSTEEFWRALGAGVRRMNPAEHDQALARTSHLPHLMAAALARVTPAEEVALTAGGWQDTTRIAAGDPALWRQILLANRQNVSSALEELQRTLAQWQAAIDSADAEAIQRLLAEGKQIRDRVQAPRNASHSAEKP